MSSYFLTIRWSGQCILKKKTGTSPNVSFLRWVSRAVSENVKETAHFEKSGSHYGENLKNLRNFFLVF